MKILLHTFIFLLLLLSCNSNGQIPDDLGDNKKSDRRVIFQDEYIKVERIWDEASKTYYFLSRIQHKDKNGNLLRLKLDTTFLDEGEAVVDFALRKGKPIITFNASKSNMVNDRRINLGTLIIEGEVFRQTSVSDYGFGIKANNELAAYSPSKKPQALIDDGVINGFSVFTPLIQDFKRVSDQIISSHGGQLQLHPRQVIAQFENHDLLVLSCGGRGFDGAGMTAYDIIRILEDLDDRIRFAHNLDGGGSVTTVIYGNQITKKIDSKGTKNRLRSTFLYIDCDNNVL